MQCSAGNCSISCPGGCGCISSSADPTNCRCLCNDATEVPGDATFALEALVDVQIVDLATAYAAALITPADQEICVPGTRVFERVTQERTRLSLKELIRAFKLVIGCSETPATSAGD
jgi:hypothetical protein